MLSLLLLRQDDQGFSYVKPSEVLNLLDNTVWFTGTTYFLDHGGQIVVGRPESIET